MGVLTGKRVERSEVSAPGGYESLSDDELERQIMERVARLGFTDTRRLRKAMTPTARPAAATTGAGRSISDGLFIRWSVYKSLL
jgi:hypothetical protein